MNIQRIKLVTIVTVSILIPAIWAAAATSPVAARQNYGQTAQLSAKGAKFPRIAVNENTGSHLDGAKEANSDGRRKKEKPAAGRSGRNGRGQSKALKPFVPSEKIPADQAVDFPVDI